MMFDENAFYIQSVSAKFKVLHPWITAVVQSTTPRFPREKTARAPELLIASTARRGTRQAVTV